MQIKKQNEIIYKINTLLANETKSVSKNISEFGYRERIKIERGLFLLLKSLCKKMLHYNLQGFSKFHREKLFNNIPKKHCDRLFVPTVEQIFQLKIFIQSLSSENAYVRGDALSRAGVDRKTVLDFIENQVKSIIKKTNSLNAEQMYED